MQENFDNRLQASLNKLSEENAQYSRFHLKTGVNYSLTEVREIKNGKKTIEQYLLVGDDGSQQWGQLSGLCQLFFDLTGVRRDNQRVESFSAAQLKKFSYVEGEDCYVLGKEIAADTATEKPTFTSNAGKRYELNEAVQLILTPAK